MQSFPSCISCLCPSLTRFNVELDPVIEPASPKIDGNGIGYFQEFMRNCHPEINEDFVTLVKNAESITSMLSDKKFSSIKTIQFKENDRTFIYTLMELENSVMKVRGVCIEQHNKIERHISNLTFDDFELKTDNETI